MEIRERGTGLRLRGGLTIERAEEVRGSFWPPCPGQTTSFSTRKR